MTGRTFKQAEQELPEYNLQFDSYQAKKRTDTVVHTFPDRSRSSRNTRFFVHGKFDVCFKALPDEPRSGWEWIHFNLDWEDGQIRKYDQPLG